MNTDGTQGEAPDPKSDKPDPVPPEIRLMYDTKPINDLTRAINEHKSPENKGGDGPGSVGERQIDAQKGGNRIAGVGVFVNALLVGGTIWAVILSSKAVNQASRAADATVRADSIYVANLKWDITKNANATYTDSVRFQRQFELNKQTADRALAETKREFEIENRPYIEVVLDSIKITNFHIGSPISISYYLANLRDITTKIIATQTVFTTDPDNPDFARTKYSIDSLLKKKKAGNINDFLVRGTPVGGHGTMKNVIPDSIMNYIDMGKYSLYLAGGVTFENMITHDIYHYYFEVKITVMRRGPYVGLYKEFLKNFNAE